MTSPLFVFGTPEGGASDVQTILEREGYVFGGDVLSSPGFLELILNVTERAVLNAAERGRSASFSETVEELIKKLYFEDGSRPDKAAIINVYTGIQFGLGLKLYSFLLEKIPDAKIVFVAMELESNYSRILAGNRNGSKWIPAYGTCASNCGFKLRNQLSQFEEFAAMRPDRAMFFNPKHGDWSKLLEFVA